VEQLGPELPAATTIWIPAARCACTAACNVSARTTFRRRTTPGVIGNVWCLCWVALTWVPAYWVSARKNSMHSMYLAGVPMFTGPSIFRQAIPLRRAPFQSGYPRRRRRSQFLWYGYRDRCHRKAPVSRCRTGCLHYCGRRHASCNRDRRSVRPSRGSEV